MSKQKELEWREKLLKLYENKEITMIFQLVEDLLLQRNAELVKTERIKVIEEVKKRIKYKAHFSKLAGSRYDGYIYIDEVLSTLQELKEKI